MASWQADPNKLRRLTGPVLFLMGGETLRFHKEARDLVHAWLPQTEDSVVPRVNAPQMLDPDGVATGNVQFLRRHRFDRAT